MSSKSSLRYEERAKTHSSPLARRLFDIASTKKTNVTVSADVATTKELLALADCKFAALILLPPYLPCVQRDNLKTAPDSTMYAEETEYFCV